MISAIFEKFYQISKALNASGQVDDVRRPAAPFRSLLSQNWLRAFVVIGVWALTTGFSVTPVVLDAISTGPRSSAQITVTNPNPASLPIEITIQEVTMDEKGQAKDRRDASAEFIILPPQATLQAGQARVFTLQYVGEADIAESRYFEWGVDQVPVTMPEGQNAVQIVYSISGILCVAPSAGKSVVDIVATRIEKNQDGKFQPVLSFRNTGNAHAFLSKGTLRLSLRDKAGKTVWRQTLREQEIEQLVGVGVLPAARTRDLTIPVDLPSSEGVVEAEVSLSKAPSRRAKRQ
ncbi:MAG: hypothetical protein RL145_1296 [Pseudomonadota bacterium]|jgi:P pilus assembly chaperone PapD